jgi:hypothetical protein
MFGDQRVGSGAAFPQPLTFRAARQRRGFGSAGPTANRRGERCHLCLPSRNDAMALSMRRWRVPALFAPLMWSTW